MEERKDPPKNDRLAIAAVLIFTIAFSLLSIGRHLALKSYLNDLGTYDQVIWNTLEGRFFDNSANMLNEPNYLGAHFSLILLLFVPLYAIFPSVGWLLIAQAAAVGMSGWAIYCLAREKLSDIWTSRMILVGYLFVPFLQNGLLYDFHEVVLATAFAAWAVYFLEKENVRGFGLMAVLLALSQEHLALLVFMMGLYWIFIKKRKKTGWITAFLALLYFVLVLKVFIPHFSTTGSSALLENHSPYPSRYAWLGTDPSGIIKNILAHPLAIAQIVLSPERLRFFLMIPAIVLAIFSPATWIILPILMINLLSSNSMTYSPYFYHLAIIVPFVFAGAVLAIRRWFGQSRLLRRVLAVAILISGVWSGISSGLTPLSPHYRLADFLPDDHARKIGEVEEIIPAEASLSVQHNLGPHFSERHWLFRFPLQAACAEYVVLDTTDPYRNDPGQVFGFGYALQLEPGELARAVEQLKQSRQYEKIYDADGYLVFRNRSACSFFK